MGIDVGSVQNILIKAENKCQCWVTWLSMYCHKNISFLIGVMDTPDWLSRLNSPTVLGLLHICIPLSVNNYIATILISAICWWRVVRICCDLLKVSAIRTKLDRCMYMMSNQETVSTKTVKWEDPRIASVFLRKCKKIRRFFNYIILITRGIGTLKNGLIDIPAVNVGRVFLLHTIIGCKIEPDFASPPMNGNRLDKYPIH